MGLSFLMALVKGTYTISSCSIPIITLRCPSMRASMLAAPMRLAIIRSCAVGRPPRCKCPSMDTRTSYCGYSFFTRSASAIAPPVMSLSATSTILLLFDFRKPFLMNSANWSTSVLNSGMIAASAPAAMAPAVTVQAATPQPADTLQPMRAAIPMRKQEEMTSCRSAATSTWAGWIQRKRLSTRLRRDLLNGTSSRACFHHARAGTIRQ